MDGLEKFSYPIVSAVSIGEFKDSFKNVREWAINHAPLLHPCQVFLSVIGLIITQQIKVVPVPLPPAVRTVRGDPHTPQN